MRLVTIGWIVLYNKWCFQLPMENFECVDFDVNTLDFEDGRLILVGKRGVQ
jgi:hypothetical protein